MSRKVLCGDIESTGGKCLLDGDVDAAKPCAIHPNVGDEVASCICDGNVHWLSNFLGLLLRCRYNPACIFQCDHSFLHCLVHLSESEHFDTTRGTQLPYVQKLLIRRLRSRPLRKS